MPSVEYVLTALLAVAVESLFLPRNERRSEVADPGVVVDVEEGSREPDVGPRSTSSATRTRNGGDGCRPFSVKCSSFSPAVAGVAEADVADAGVIGDGTVLADSASVGERRLRTSLSCRRLMVSSVTVVRNAATHIRRLRLRIKQ